MTGVELTRRVPCATCGGTTTHKEIAKKFGISRSHASQILNGNRGLWSKEMTAKEGTNGR